MTTPPRQKRKQATAAKTKVVYQFLYGTLPSAAAPIAIDSSAVDAKDEFFQRARSVTPWAPLGPIVLPETGGDGRIHPVPKLMWVRSLEVPASDMKVVAPIDDGPAEAKKESRVITIPPGTLVEDLLLRRPQ